MNKIRQKFINSNFPIFPTSGIYLLVKTGKNHPVFTTVVFTTPTLLIALEFYQNM
jgi:hypothetical protein